MTARQTICAIERPAKAAAAASFIVGTLLLLLIRP